MSSALSSTKEQGDLPRDKPQVVLVALSVPPGPSHHWWHLPSQTQSLTKSKKKKEKSMSSKRDEGQRLRWKMRQATESLRRKWNRSIKINQAKKRSYFFMRSDCNPCQHGVIHASIYQYEWVDSEMTPVREQATVCIRSLGGLNKNKNKERGGTWKGEDERVPRGCRADLSHL